MRVADGGGGSGGDQQWWAAVVDVRVGGGGGRRGAAGGGRTDDGAAGTHRVDYVFQRHDEIRDSGLLRIRRDDEKLWIYLCKNPITENVLQYICLAGFSGVIECEYRRLDSALISALVERWRPETHTFHMPFGEVTITLQDVAVLLGLKIDGNVVNGIDQLLTTEQIIANFYSLTATNINTIEIGGATMLLQLWAWERIPSMATRSFQQIDWNKSYGASSQPVKKTSSWVIQKWKRPSKNVGSSTSSGHEPPPQIDQMAYTHANQPMGFVPNIRSVHQQSVRKWAILDDESENWSNDHIEGWVGRMMQWRRRQQQNEAAMLNEDHVQSYNDLIGNRGVHVCMLMEFLVTGKPMNVTGDIKNWCVAYRRYMADQMYFWRCLPRPGDV
ncbi:hypothetical protein E3N88_38046 [Mikania micrantha]|uniref:Aminotransferase-like plant mobile domain-containing protein n=1 Tax=Mikania micrantha TaxID=192012 RepID=A0A5N6LT00_9ASTR|nr:hypothetical protein E3N88_38046 [Mikania micrantha]